MRLPIASLHRRRMIGKGVVITIPTAFNDAITASPAKGKGGHLIMKQKRGVIKKVCFISLLLLSITGLAVFIGCSNGGGGGGNGGGGAGGGTPTSFTTATLFPLRSGWQTDQWTLFVDINDHDINGVATRAMADTQEPKVLYWTNDEQGLRLHAVLTDEGDLWVFPAPILLANRICKLGDVITGTYLIDTEEYNYRLPSSISKSSFSLRSI